MEIHVSDQAERAVFLSAEELVQVRARCEREPWAAAVRDGIVQEANSLVQEPLEIPHAGGQWTHWYTCREDGGSLKARTPTEHICSVCGNVYSGWPYDEVYVTQRHSHWLRGLETLGWAYALEPKPAYAERARTILLEYAGFYGDLELHDVHNKQGSSKARLYAQTLDESVTLCHIAAGYDRVYDAPCFSAEDHQSIEQGLLRPMVATIQVNPRAISNWQSWHNAGVGCAGFLLRDKALVDWAINGKAGFLYQMARGSVLESGLWYEESPSYHWYALSAHVYLLEAAARAGADLYVIPIVKKMFDAPIRQLFPDGTFPAINDSNRHAIASVRSYYEVAYKRFADSHYLCLLEPRDSPWALFWGADIPADVERPALRLTTSNEESEGLAILRDAAGTTAFYLDYGQGRSGHVHPAKLNILLYAHGEERFVDPGRLPYGNPLHKKWYRQTLAHNTVVVGGASQRLSPGKLEAFGATDSFALARATSGRAYQGVMLDRTLLMAGNTIIDVFRCHAPEDTVFDLPLHVRGDLGELPPCAPCAPLGKEHGYDLLKDPCQCTGPLTSVDIQTGEGRRIHAQFFEEAECYRAMGLGETPQELLPVIIRRIRGKAAVFVATYQILDAGEEPDAVSADLGDEVAVRVKGLTLRAGEATIVEEKGARYRVGREGVKAL